MTKDNSDMPGVIWLMDMGDGIVWCDDPAPGLDMDEADATKYTRTDILEEMAGALESTLGDLTYHINNPNNPRSIQKTLDDADTILTKYRAGDKEDE